MKSNDLNATVLLIGSDRISKLTPALENANGFNLESDVWKGNNKFRSPSELVKLKYHILKLKEPLVLIDSMGIQALQTALITDYYDIDFLIRSRGGMWKEYRDERHDDPVYIQKLYEFSKEKIRNISLRKADGIIPVSHFHKLQIIEEVDVDPNKCSVVHTPVDFSRFENSEPFQDYPDFIDPDKKTLLSVTSFQYKNKYYGIIDYSEVIVKFLKDNPEWEFVVCGPGDRDQREDLQRWFERIASQKILSRISIVGYQDQIEKIYETADIYVHLSFRDSMGMTVLEAQSAGNPVIVNNSGGPIDLVRKDQTEVKNIANTHEELARSLNQLASRPKLQSKVGQENQRWVNTRFTYSKIGKKFSEAIPRLTQDFD